MQKVSTKLVREGEPGPQLSGPGMVAGWAASELELEPQENVIAVHLNTKLRPVSWTLVSLGTADQAMVVPRDVFRAAIRANATSVVVVHNHPSGDPTPSREDHDVFELLLKAGNVVGIPVHDFIVTGADGRYVSLRDF